MRKNTIKGILILVGLLAICSILAFGGNVIFASAANGTNSTNSTNATNTTPLNLTRAAYVPIGVAFPVTNATNTTIACVDSDGGRLPLIFGITSVSAPLQTFQDTCVTPTRLREYYCVATPVRVGRIFAQDYTCIRGCSAGRCNP